MSAIRDALAVTPAGDAAIPLSDAELSVYLKAHCARPDDIAREQDHALRNALFCDGGVAEMKRRIDGWFESDTVRSRIKRLVADSRFSNATKRIVSEMSTVYAEPATRAVGGSEANQRAYASLVEAMNLDEENDRVCQQYNLHRAIVVFPRVRQTDAGPEVVLDVHSAATARPIMAPNDNTLVVGWLTRCSLRTVRGALARPVAWMLTTSVEWEYLDEHFVPIPGTRIEHGIGAMPAIALSSGSKSQPDFWPGDEGADITAGHLAGWLFNSLLVKETKTTTRQPVISGDGTTMARGQVLDGEGVVETPEGVAMTTVDIGTDVDTFLRADDHQLERVGANHGVSLAALKQQGTQSAEARELMLAPIRERRKKQVKLFRRYERQLAALLSLITARFAPALTFDVIEWRIDFGEPQVLLSKKERLEIFKIERGLGLDNTIAFEMRENPDLTFEQAKAAVLENIDLETWRVGAMKQLMAIGGGFDTTVDGATNNPPPQAAHMDAPHAEPMPADAPTEAAQAA